MRPTGARLATIAAAIAVAVSLCAPAHAFAPASAPVDGSWYTNQDSLVALLAASPTVVGEMWDRPDSYEWIGSIPDGWSTTPYVNYGSYARFVSDLLDGSVPPVHVLMYDPELWDMQREPELQAGSMDPLRALTPIPERQHPIPFMRRFARLAHRTGYVVIEAPGLNLVDVPGGDCVHGPGETFVAAYLRCGLAGAAARYSDAIDVQFQSIQCDTALYASSVAAAAKQANAANPSAEVLSGLSAGWCRPTGDQLFAAHRAVAGFTVGHFLAIPSNVLGAVDFLARLTPVIVGDASFSPEDQVQMQAVTATWRVSWNATMQHSVTDRSGLDLFDSGLKGAGSVFRYRFAGAGTYTATDVATGHTGTISVPVRVSPASGGTTTTFVVTTSSSVAPAGYAYETQILRPGASGWVDWRFGISNPFVPDVGVGTYSFRAQLRRKSNGAASGWSPAASIVVA